MDAVTKKTITKKRLATEVRLLDLQKFTEYNNLDGIDELLREGTPINGKALNELTCLEVANAKKSKIVLDLLNRGASKFHLPDDIITAVKKGKMDQVGQALWENKNLVHCRDAYGNTLLHIAAEENNESMIELLKQRGVQEGSTNQYGETYAEVAELSQMKEMKLLSLQACAANDDREEIVDLLAEGIPINGIAKKIGVL